MANLWCDGLARYGGTKSYMLNGSSGQAWAEVDDAFTLSSENPRTGTHCLRMNESTGTDYARRVFGSNLTEAFFGYAFYASNLPTVDPETGGDTDGVILAEFRNASNAAQVSVSLGTDGSLIARRGSTILGRSDPCIGAGAYQHLEFHCVCDDTAGAIEVRVDQVTKLNLTGLNTDPTGTGVISQVVVGRSNYNQQGQEYDWADFFANDTTDDSSGCHTWIGDVKSGDRVPDSNTAQDDFTKSSGTSAYELIDERGPNDGDYLETSSSTAQTNVGISNGAANVTEILTVRPYVRAQKDDAGTASIAPSMVSNGTKATVSAQPIATAFAYYDSNVPLNPDTSAPWDPADLDAALEAIERTA